MTLQRRSPVAIGFALLVLAAVSVGVVGTAGVDTVGAAEAGTVDAAAAGDAPDDNALVAVQDDAAESNETTRHEHPDEASGEGDDEALADWLQSELGQSLGDSTIQLSQGQYERAQSVVGDNYDDRLDQYVDVAGDVGGEDDNRTEPETFERAQRNQRRFVDSVRTYRETREEYERAKENGNEQRARELARELERIAQNASRSGRTLERTYGNISESSDVDLGEERDAAETIRRDIEETQTEIRDAEFLETRISAEANSVTTSFLDPVAITGRVVDEEGSAVAGQRVRIRVDGRTVATTTDENGDFELNYRPALLPIEAQEIDVEFAPATDSVYLASNTTVPVLPIEVSQVESEIDVESAPDAAAFGDTVSVTGRVHAADVPADGVPVAVVLDGQFRTAPVRTDDNGTFRIDAVLPAEIPDGERDLRVVYPRDGRALAGSETTRSLTVVSTPTELSVSAEETATGAITASGRLATADGEAIAGQTVRLTVDGRTVETVETNDDGSFETTIDAPDAADDGTVQLAAAYAQEGTNLEDARAETELSLASSESGSLLPPMRWLLGGLLALVGVGLLALLVVAGDSSRPTIAGVLSVVSDDEDDESDGPSGGSVQGGDGPGADDPAASAALPAPDVLARQRLEAGDTDRATALAYELTRPRLATELTDDAARTHWEFYSEWRAIGDEDRSDALRQLTEAYERAVFAPDAVSGDDASVAIRAATSLVPDADER